MNTNRSWLPGAFFLALASFHGLACSSGPTLYPVEGKVMHKGKEAEGVTVTFHPKEGDPVKVPRSIGFTRADGTFKLTTVEKSGAPAGAYVVTMIWQKEVPPDKKKGEMNMSMGVETYDALDGAYAEISKSKIEITIKAGDNKLEPIRLE